MIYHAPTVLLIFALAACTPAAPTPQRVTVEPTRIGQGAPIFTATPSLTPSHTPTPTETPTATLSPTASATPTETATATSTLTVTPSPTITPTFTASPTATLPPSATPPLVTLTPALRGNAVDWALTDAGVSETAGWSCGDFPCADDIAGFYQRIRVSAGFAVEYGGQFPGQVQQITYGRDGRLYATVWEDGTLTGAVYVMAEDGTTTRYSQTMLSPLGLAFQPNSDVLYVSARTTPLSGGTLWQILPDGTQTALITDLPCCYQEIGNQPNGLTFGQDGLLYLGVGARTDHSEGAVPQAQAYDPLQPFEAAVLRINPHTNEISVYANGLRNPFDVTQDSGGVFYATDTGVVSGAGDRVLRLSEGGFFGFPYYRARGCNDCPPSMGAGSFLPDLLGLPDYSLPRGIVAYTGQQFPANVWDTLFVVLWNGTDYAQRVIWVDPNNIPTDTAPLTFLSGLVRPIDVAIAPDGALVVADFVYGQIWRVTYTGDAAPTTPTGLSFLTPTVGTLAPSATAETVRTVAPSGFATNTPSP